MTPLYQWFSNCGQAAPLYALVSCHTFLSLVNLLVITSIRTGQDNTDYMLLKAVVWVVRLMWDASGGIQRATWYLLLKI